MKRFENQIAEAQNKIDLANARIAPLFKLAGTEDSDALQELIAQSDEYRSLKNGVDECKSAAEANGDSLAMNQLVVETIGIDIAQIPVRLSEISRDLAAARDIQEEDSANLATANAELRKISGSDEAARSESARQDALSRMGDATARFIKVHIAGKLLRWAIDRFRETKQGPMLARASEIFSGLTLGSFSKLVVDFESDPPRLDGLRPDGRTVGISGMSDGTRDQLYLALRIAALEMHLGQGHALPFIADDLFINYDDERSSAGLEALARLSELTQVIFQSHRLYGDPYVKNRRGVFEYVLGGLQDSKLLDVRVFDEATKKSVYTKQTIDAKVNGISNCQLCAVGHGANKSKIFSFAEMDADHVAAWSKGGGSSAENCQMLCITHNRAKGNR